MASIVNWEVLESFDQQLTFVFFKKLKKKPISYELPAHSMISTFSRCGYNDYILFLRDIIKVSGHHYLKKDFLFHDPTSQFGEKLENSQISTSNIISDIIYSISDLMHMSFNIFKADETIYFTLTLFFELLKLKNREKCLGHQFKLIESSRTLTHLIHYNYHMLSPMSLSVICSICEEMLNYSEIMGAKHMSSQSLKLFLSIQSSFRSNFTKNVSYLSLSSVNNTSLSGFIDSRSYFMNHSLIHWFLMLFKMMNKFPNSSLFHSILNSHEIISENQENSYPSLFHIVTLISLFSSISDDFLGEFLCCLMKELESQKQQQQLSQENDHYGGEGYEEEEDNQIIIDEGGSFDNYSNQIFQISFLDDCIISFSPISYESQRYHLLVEQKALIIFSIFFHLVSDSSYFTLQEFVYTNALFHEFVSRFLALVD